MQLDAMHLIKATRHALAECASVEEIVAEARQAQAVARAIGGHLAAHGPQSVRADAFVLSDAGGRVPLPRNRSGRLSQIQDVKCALDDLSSLLAEAGVALVLVSVTAREEGLYWQCIEAIDAADECQDCVTGMLRRLAEARHGPAA